MLRAPVRSPSRPSFTASYLLSYCTASFLLSCHCLTASLPPVLLPYSCLSPASLLLFSSSSRPSLVLHFLRLSSSSLPLSCPSPPPQPLSHNLDQMRDLTNSIS